MVPGVHRNTRWHEKTGASFRTTPVKWSFQRSLFPLRGTENHRVERCPQLFSAFIQKSLANLFYIRTVPLVGSGFDSSTTRNPAPATTPMSTSHTPGLGMDPRAAKALATIFCELVDAQITIQICTENQVNGDRGEDTMTRRATAWKKASKCKTQIQDWLQQPMTTAHLRCKQGGAE